MSLQEMYTNTLKEMISAVVKEVMQAYAKHGFERDTSRKVTLDKSTLTNVWDLTIPIAEEKGRIFSMGCGMLQEGNQALTNLHVQGERMRATVYDIYDDKIVIELTINTPNHMEV